jgi:TRAP-type C4-dicarboxylate transport system permease small subunit
MDSESLAGVISRREHGAFEIAARLVRGGTWTLLAAAASLFVLSIVVYTIEIVLRGFFFTSFPEYYEIVAFSFIYVYLLGAAALYARNEDVVIELLYNRLPEVLQRWLLLLIQIGIAVTMVTVFIHAVKIIDLQMHTPTPLLGVPEAIKWIPLAIAAAWITLSASVEAWAAIVWIRTGERLRVWTEPFFDLDE